MAKASSKTKKKSAAKAKRKIARSAKDGRFVSKKYAAKHPSTTVTESRRSSAADGDL